MVGELIAHIAEWVTHVISVSGYAGVFGLLFIDAMNIPLPSEISLGFAGYLVSTGRFTFFWAVMVGTLGYTAGAALSYWIGLKGGRRVVERYGRFLLISKRDLARADKLFKKYGNAIAFFSRMLPVLRTFISLPAGVFKVPFGRYIAYTFVGSLLWSVLFVYLGQLVGENYEILAEKMHGVEYVVVGVSLLGAIRWVWH
jgi:membrane protein DedA with SNARE-associated domain